MYLFQLHLTHKGSENLKNSIRYNALYNIQHKIERRTKDYESLVQTIALNALSVSAYGGRRET